MIQKIRQDMVIGGTIRKLRNQSKLTQEEVIARMQILGVEISRSSYSQIECGTYNIKVSELAALKEIFHTDYNSFFESVVLKKN